MGCVGRSPRVGMSTRWNDGDENRQKLTRDTAITYPVFNGNGSDLAKSLAAFD